MPGLIHTAGRLWLNRKEKKDSSLQMQTHMGHSIICPCSSQMTELKKKVTGQSPCFSLGVSIRKAAVAQMSGGDYRRMGSN